jgi:hypothetical protein
MGAVDIPKYSSHGIPFMVEIGTVGQECHHSLHIQRKQFDLV